MFRGFFQEEVCCLGIHSEHTIKFLFRSFHDRLFQNHPSRVDRDIWRAELAFGFGEEVCALINLSQITLHNCGLHPTVLDELCQLECISF